MKFIFAFSLSLIFSSSAIAEKKNVRVPSSGAHERVTLTGQKADQLAAIINGSGDCGGGKCTYEEQVTVRCTGERYEDGGDVNKSKNHSCTITRKDSSSD